jgi:hypothetical protein
MTTTIKTPLACVLEFENSDDMIRESASEKLGVTLGNGDGEYPWMIENAKCSWKDNVLWITFEIGVEDRPN